MFGFYLLTFIFGRRWGISEVSLCIMLCNLCDALSTHLCCNC